MGGVGTCVREWHGSNFGVGGVGQNFGAGGMGPYNFDVGQKNGVGRNFGIGGAGP